MILEALFHENAFWGRKSDFYAQNAILAKKRTLGSESAIFAKFCEFSLFGGFLGPPEMLTH